MPDRITGVDREDVVLLGDRRLPSKGERQRRAILDCLPGLLATRPITELTVGEIAAAARVQRSGFYFYFESKYAALAVITSEIWSELMDRARFFSRSDDESAADFIGRTADIALELWRDHEGVLMASVQAIPLDEQLADLWQDWILRLADGIAGQVLEDQKQGLAHPVSSDVPTLTSTLLEMTMHIFYVNRLRQQDQRQTAKVREMVRSIWLASAWGITEPQGDSPASRPAPRRRRR
ncbi:TetR family transcriptional regulator [Mycolicibacterium flavescens]|uniref:TetR/AcrR family transcriptional regulator n=1 Tax=Mycobacterium neumannii TaxID=2048551 RepID=UPI000B93B2A7|nr:TetR/AcrR family transcriptional regulator [Mycobacterium neumannii]VEG47114.1 TetR family transcriptional regulator [Mycolicibacterium flavescens]